MLSPQENQTRRPPPPDHDADRRKVIPFRRVVTKLALKRFPGEPPAKIRRHVGRVLKAYCGETVEKIIKHVEISLRNERQRKAKAPAPWAPLETAKRMADLEATFVRRYGRRRLPDDDAGEHDFEIVAHHLAHAFNDPKRRIVAWAAEWWPELPEHRAKSVAARVVSHPQKWTSAKLGIELNLTLAEYEALPEHTIRPNIPPEEWDARCRERRKKYDRARRATGRPPGRPRKTEPDAWIAEGVSRATHFRRKARARAKPPRKGETKTPHSHLISGSAGFQSHAPAGAAANTTGRVRAQVPMRDQALRSPLKPFPADGTATAMFIASTGIAGGQFQVSGRWWP